MGKHSTPCKYVHHWCHLCSSPGPAGFATLVLPGAGPGHCWLPEGRAQQHPDPLPGLQQQGGKAPTAAWGWARSWPAGWTHGALPSLAVPCS